MNNSFQNILATRQNLEQEYCDTFLIIDQFFTQLMDERERILRFDPLR